MSKIICDICGTSYPETAKQCPICGCVRPGDVQRVTNEVKSDGNVSTGYTNVKGGHFSKSNVKKRAKNSNYSSGAKNKDIPKSYDREKDSRGLVITAIILLLAVIGVVIYIAIRFFAPISNPNDNTGTTGTQQSYISCTDIILDKDTLLFDQEGEVLLLNVSVEPKNTSDTIGYRSENHSVVTVNDVGKVTVVGEGTTNIVITCGKITKKCAVTVQYPEESTGIENTEDTSATDPTGETGVTTEVLMLNRKDITFNIKDSNWNLYDGNIPRDQIQWSSDDESVATIANGVVVAVGNGVTTVYAEIGDQKVSCIIRCSFKGGNAVSGNGGVSEDGGGSNVGGAVTGTVYNTDTLNVRENPVENPTIERDNIIGQLLSGDRVTILEQKTVGGMTWGKISQGWISMDYVQVD